MEPDTSPPLVEELTALGLALLDQIERISATMLRPWIGGQILIALMLVGVAHVLSRLAGPRLHAWMRSREGWPRWRMRLFVVIHRRLRAIFFVLLIWLTVAVMQEATWPSRSYLLGIIANLALAWLIVIFATRLIGSPFLRSLVRYGAWIWISLNILGLTQDVERLLEAAAIDIGQVRISLWMLLQAAVILGVLFAVARFVSRAVSARIAASEEMSPSMQVLMVKLLQIALYAVVFFIGLQVVGVDLTGLAFLSGAIGLGLGFGLQKVVSNLVSGVIILMDKSIKPGDVISLDETFGWINSLGARYVSITTRDGKEYLIPNEDLITGQVVNWSHSNNFVRLDIHFGTSYGNDPHQVRRVAIAAASSVPRVLGSTPPVCHVTGFGDSSVDYILRFWISDPAAGLTNIRGNVFLALWDAFRENGITIPFPQREVRLLDGNSETSLE